MLPLPMQPSLEPDHLLSQWTGALLACDPAATVTEQTAGFVRLRLGEGPSMLALLVDGKHPEALEPAYQDTKLKPGQTLHVLVLGDDERASAQLKKLVPNALAQGRFAVHAHVWSPGRRLRTVRGFSKGILPQALKRLSKGERFDTESAVEQRAADAEAARRYLEPVLARRPWVTWTVAALSALLFGLQLLWGGGEAFVPAVRMGAAVRDLVDAGQWYRLLASTLLHGSVLHLGFNLLALFAFGTFLERVLGARRYLLVYVASALGGDLASLFLRSESAVSVGASGGIWGLMVAGAALVTWPRGRLPSLVAASKRLHAWSPVVVNALFSFKVPNIDVLAHLGGGLVGGLLVVTGLVTLGLPRADEVSSGARGLRRDGPVMSLMAGVSGLLLLGSAGAALVEGRAWELGARPATKLVELSDDPYVLALPSLAGPSSFERNEAGRAYSFGALTADPAAFIVFTSDAELTPEEAQDHEASLGEVMTEVKFEPLEGFRKSEDYALKRRDDRWYLEAKQSSGDGRQGFTYLFIIGSRVVGAHVFLAAGVSADWKAVAIEAPFSLRAR